MRLLRSVTTSARALLAVFLTLALSLTACGGGGSEKKKEGDATPKATGAAAGDIEEYCKNFLAIETAQPENIDFEAPPQQQAEGAKQFATEELRPLADKIIAARPDEIRSELSVLNDAVTELQRTGDFGVFDKPEVKEADEAVDEYNVENCGWNKVNVTATDYAFGGVSPVLAAGPTSFELSNNGTEHHEMVIHRKNDGVTETFDQLLALPQDQLEAKVTFAGVTDALPKEEGAHDAVADLKPGQYSIVCFIPVGSTPEAEKKAMESGKEVEGPPHLTRGMKTEFTVR